MVTVEGKAEGAAQVLHENESAVVEKQTGGQGLTVRRVSVDSAVFVRPEQLPKIIEEQNLKPFRRWQVYSQELRRDPSLLAYYDFQRRDESTAVLSNVAKSRGSSLDGIIENATWCRGRMIGKQALRFNGPDDCIHINLPHKVDDLTVASWIYIESLYCELNGLLLSDGWGPGKLHWQVHTDGRLQLAINGLPGTPFYSKSAVFDHARFRQWTHLAFVYDHFAACLIFYVDGQLIEKINVLGHLPINIGPACLGYWRPDSGDTISVPTVRNFRGRIDEMAIFGRAMQADWVQQMYRAGSPEASPQNNRNKKGGDSDIPIQ